MTAYALRGTIVARAEMGGVVYSSPYAVTDIVTNVGAQPIDLPRVLARNRAWFSLNPGQRAQLPKTITAADLPDQVWQMVKLGLLSVGRTRSQRISDGDASPIDFVALPRRPELRARYDAARGVLTVWRDLDDITAQRIVVNNLTPQVAFATSLTGIADVGKPAEFTVQVIAAGTARFGVEVVGHTHAGLTATAVVAP